MLKVQYFSTAARLQEYILSQAGPESLVVVPHRRLARQLWHRQRLNNLGRSGSAWEPLTALTLGDWWEDLFRRLWPPVAVAPRLVRLSLWLQAMRAVPPLEGTAADLSWAKALDEAHEMLCRHGLPLDQAGPALPLVGWRRQVMQHYRCLLKDGGWLTPAELPAYLGGYLAAGKLSLPQKILVVGLEMPAPVEETWLTAVARHTEVVHLEVRGDKGPGTQALVLPDREQEAAWVLAFLMDTAHRDGMPWHSLAITSPDLEIYSPLLRRLLRELLGPPETCEGSAYNFSQGPKLTDTPLFQAALLPAAFFCRGEGREELAAWLWSPFYRVFADKIGSVAVCDRGLREHRVERGWEACRGVFTEIGTRDPGVVELLSMLEQVAGSCPASPALGRQWLTWLTDAWHILGFPNLLTSIENGHLCRLLDVLQSVAAVIGGENLTGQEWCEWLQVAAEQVILPGPGREEAGLQVLGLLEMRGLDFARVVCLGLNAGVFPAPPRPLPLLSPVEKTQVLGGTTPSQHRFAKVLFENLLGTAPQVILTRPGLVEDEEQVGTPLWQGEWQPQELALLSHPHPVWLQVPAVAAAFQEPTALYSPRDEPLSLSVPIPASLSVSQAQTALLCPCRFLLEVVLRLAALPEVEAGIPPWERGEKLHAALHHFVRQFQPFLDKSGWQDKEARRHLEAAVQQVLVQVAADLDWQAEARRWLGGEAGEPGLLMEWLAQEKQRYAAGWRWLAAEADFDGLQLPAVPFVLRGRVDRLDHHPDLGAILWDYKSGTVPGKSQVFVDCREWQLPGYLLAARAGLLPLPQPHTDFRAGFIGLKSSRVDHLKYEDFRAEAADWERLVESYGRRLAEAGQRLAAGDFRPDPTPPPRGIDEGACAYCLYKLICGVVGQEPSEDAGLEE